MKTPTQNLFDILFSERQSLGEQMEDSGKREELFSILPVIGRMYGFDQNNPYHDYDLLMHTVKTVDGLRKEGITKEEYRLLKTAALLHDAGKPDTIVIRPDGYYSYYNHSERSAVIARENLMDLGMPQNDIGRITFYVLAHDMFLDVLRNEEIDEKRVLRTILRWHRKHAGPGITPHDYTLLTYLVEADAAAHRMNQDKEVQDKLNRIAAIRQICRHAEQLRPGEQQT